MKTATSQKSYKAHAGVLLLALVFWFMVKMSKDYDYTLEIPLKVTITNEEVCLKYPPPDDIVVEFTGRGIDLLQLNFYQPAYEIDLSEERGKLVLNLSEHREYVRVSDDVSVQVKSIVRPHEIEFELDQRLSRKVPVKVDAEVKTDNGFIWVGSVVEPDSVLVSGPATYVDSLRHLHSEKKVYQKVRMAFHDKMHLLKDEQFYGDYLPEKVEVFYDVQRLGEKEISEVPVKVVNTGNYQVVPLPSKVKVYVKGGEKILAEAGAEDFEVEIDFGKEWQPGTEEVRATVKTKLNISYVESRPAKFQVLVQKKRN